MRELFALTFFQDLNAATVSRNWTVLATLGCLAVGAVALGLLGHLWDQRERRAVASELFASHAALSRGVLVNRTQRNRNGPNSDRSLNTMLSPGGRNQTSSFLPPTSPKMKLAARIIRRPAAKGRLDRSNDPIHLLEDSLPQVLQIRTKLLHRMMREMAQHHRWLAVLTRYSETFPRSLRVLSLATNIIVMLFMQAIVYTLSNPNDGTCGKLTSQAACLRPRADFSGGGVGKCSWKPQRDTGGGECIFAEPSDAVMVVLFVALFSAVVSAPIAVFLHRIIQNTLAAPLSLDPLSSSSSGKLEKKTLLQSLFVGGVIQEKEQQAEEDRQVYEQLVSLQHDLQKHRVSLSEKDRTEFDGTPLIIIILSRQL